FNSCSHGAGRAMSRHEAKKRFTVEDHIRMTQGVECRKDRDVIDETPAAYKPIDAVMVAQADLVDIAHTLTRHFVLFGRQRCFIGGTSDEAVQGSHALDGYCREQTAGCVRPEDNA